MTTSTYACRTAPMAAHAISRRSFLAGLGSIATAAALLAIGEQLPNIGMQPVAADLTLRRSLFAGELGAQFQAHAESASLPLQLIAVRDLHTAIYQRPGIDREQNFSLLFHSPLGRPLDQGTYRFAHSRIGSFPLFIVPVRNDPQATHYEAIFSRQPA